MNILLVTPGLVTSNELGWCSCFVNKRIVSVKMLGYTSWVQLLDLFFIRGSYV